MTTDPKVGLLLGVEMRKARRHRDEFGEVIEVFADRPGPKTVTGVVVGWVLFTALTFINPGETPLLAIAPGVIFAVMFGLILLYLSGERLIVCERGILVGSVAPGIRPYAIPYGQITPGSVAGVTGANRYLKEVGLQGADSAVDSEGIVVDEERRPLRCLLG